MYAAIVMIRTECDRAQDVARSVADIDGVAEVYSVAGKWDVVAVVRVTEWNRISDVVTEKIAGEPGVERTHTMMAFRIYSKQDLETAYDMFE